MIVVCDTSPLNYLVLIGHIDLLPVVLREVVVPPAVLGEMQDRGAASRVREWASRPPGWVSVRGPRVVDASIALGIGERSALSLAIELVAGGR